MLVGALVLGTKIYFFSTFASAAGNPDPEACWVAAGDRQVYPDEVEDADMVDYGELFREWFAYGTVLFMVAILLQIIAMVTASAGTAASGVLRVTRLLQVIHFLFYLAWLYYGVRCRFSEGGRVAAGEYRDELDEEGRELLMTTSGAFIKIYIIAALVLILLPSIVWLIAGTTVLCINRRRKSKERPEATGSE